MGVILPPTTQILITLDNRTGAVKCEMSSAVPFPQVVAIFGQLLGQFAGQVALQVDKTQVIPSNSGGKYAGQQ